MIVALVHHDVNLYTSSDCTTLGYDIATLAMIGRRALVRKASTFFLKEDVVSSLWENLPLLYGDLLGVAFGRFIRATRWDLQSSLDGRKWKMVCSKPNADWAIVNGAVAYSSHTGSAYSLDGLRWCFLPTCGKIVFVGSLVLTKYNQHFTIYKSGNPIRQLVVPFPYTVVSWHGHPVIIESDALNVVYENTTKIFPCPKHLGHIQSNNFMLAIDHYVTTDLLTFTEVVGDIVVVDGKMIAVDHKGYRILNSPGVFEKVVSDVEKSRSLLASLRHLNAPFSLFFFLISSF
jgi:hypothetical protein